MGAGAIRGVAQMSRVHPPYYAFNGGEVDARTLARADLETYPRTAETLENVFISRTGSMAKAPGTQFIAATPDNGAAVLKRFAYGSVRHVLEFSDGLIRFVTGSGMQSIEGDNASFTFSDESGTTPVGGDPPSDGGVLPDPEGGGSWWYEP